MTITFKNAVATIDKTDAFKLAFMAESVLNNRPSFRSIQGKVGTETADIYTECPKHLGHQEQLTVRVGESQVYLQPQDKDALEQVIRDTRVY